MSTHRSRLLSLSVVALALLLRVGSPAVAAEVALYLSPDGNDAWSGTRADRDATGQDGPFATPARALAAVAEARARDPRSPVTVHLRGGTYALDRPLALTPAHSGSPDAPVTLAAHGEERPVLSAGRRVTGWSPAELGGRACWAADVPQAKDGRWVFRELWVNGTRATRARHPNKGYLAVEVAPEAGGDWQTGQSRFRYKEGEVTPTDLPPDAEAIVCTRWVESRLPIVGVDSAERMLRFARHSQWRIEPNDPYWLEGAAAWLDQPGEWFLDARAGRLHYLPREGEDLSKAEVIAPVLEQVLRLEGDPEKGEFVDHVTLRGLTFSHAEWNLPPPPAGTTQPVSGGYAQADLNVSAAVWGQGVRNCAFENVTVAHTGTYALHLERGCQGNRVTRGTFTDLGAGGVRIGETARRDPEKEKPSHTFGNEVSDCRITDGGHVYPAAVGVWIGLASDNRIVHNEVADFYYSGFSVGWSWGYADTLCRGNVIEGNHVHHIGVRSSGDGPILSDMGGIYTLGVQPGTVIRRNVFHDIAGYKYGGWGIYLDEGSTNILVEHNLAHHTTHGGFHLHYGRDNVVRGNVFAFARDHQVQHSRPEEHNGFTFEDNVVYWTSGLFLNPGATNAVYRNNRYGPIAPADFRAGAATWDQWRASGKDEGTTFVGKVFVDPEKGDFRLAPSTQPADLKIDAPARAQDVGPR